jgi:hypothetical protein
MTHILQISDGTHSASFDGFVVEISGINGAAHTRRFAIETLENVGALAAKGEIGFGVKSKKGGGAVMFGLTKQAEWQALADAVNAAISALPAQ